MNNIKLDNRHLLWLLMEFPIHRYLLANTKGRLNGMEKAEKHLALSAIYVAAKKNAVLIKQKVMMNG